MSCTFSQGDEHGLPRLVGAIEIERKLRDGERLHHSVVEFEHLASAGERHRCLPGDLCLVKLEGALNLLEFREASQRDLDRALQLFGPGIHDVGVHASFCCLVDPVCVVAAQQRDNGAEGAADDLCDQVQSVLRALPEPDECHVGTVFRRHRGNVRDMNLAGDHLMAEALYHLGKQRKTIRSFVGDQNAKMMCPVHNSTPS